MDFFGMIGTVLFISWLDWVAYTFLSLSYSVFLAVSQINIFATEGGMAIFETVSTQLYTVVGIAMIFVFAYQLVLLIINPDNGNQKSPSKLFFDSVISMITVLVLPTIFNYMTIFQGHVLSNGTIPAILLGTSATTDIGDDAGNKIAMMVLISFYHPKETTYSTFYGIDGELKSSAVSDCTSANGDSSTCQNFYDALADFESDHKIASITGVESIRKAVYKGSESMSYMWVLSTVAAVFVAWFFITYSIDIGTRAVKLGFLQLIAPAPVILRIFPQTRKTFEMWFGELKKTYIEIFIRLAVIFFVVRLIQIVPDLIGAIFSSTSDVVDNVLLQCIAVVILILGLLKFAQEAPELIKNMFNNGGNLLDGLNLKPGVRKHIEDNKLGMKGISMGAGAVSGMIGGAGNAIRAAYNRTPKDQTTGQRTLGWGKKAGAAIYGGVRGAVTGAVHGSKNTMEHLNRKDFQNQRDASATAAQESYNKGTALEKIIRAGQDVTAQGGNVIDAARAMNDKRVSMAEKAAEKRADARAERRAAYYGESMATDARIETLSNLTQLASGLSTIVDSDTQLTKLKKDHGEELTALKNEHAGIITKRHEMNMSEKDEFIKAGVEGFARQFVDVAGKMDLTKTFTAADLNGALDANGNVVDLSQADAKLQLAVRDMQHNGKTGAEIADFLKALQQTGESTYTMRVSENDRHFASDIQAQKQRMYDEELAAMERRHQDSIDALRTQHAAEVQSMKDQHKADEQRRIAEIHSSNKAVQETMQSYMSSMNKILEDHGHQMADQLVRVNELVSNTGMGASTLQELSDMLSKDGSIAARATPELEKLMKDIADELKLQNSQQALQEKNKDGNK